MELRSYVTLGRSGLRVSQLCLGTMTFGTETGWGANEEEARSMFDRYVEQGGNFFDTANTYAAGTSEKWLGKFIREAGLRAKTVISTKFSVSSDQQDPNAGGNGRKNIYRSVEGSMTRLGTDYIDIYWMHMWDAVTPLEEVLSTLNDLVREGKIRHFGLSDVPAWYAARLHTVAEKEGKERPIALQLEYSLVERNIEREHLPAAQEMGWGLCPWSPLAGGILTGKYHQKTKADGRMETQKANPFLNHENRRTPEIVATLVDVAKEMGATPAQVALNWAVTQPSVSSVIIGATRAAQLEDNLRSLSLTVPVELRARLNEASDIDVVHPYDFYRPPRSMLAHGKTSVRRWKPM